MTQSVARRPLTVLLAEDHQVVRDGLRLLLEKEGFAVVGETASGLEVAELAARLTPGVLVLDLMLPGLGGLDVIREVLRRSPRTHIVVLSMHASDTYVYEALRHGALAYVLKDASSAELLRAIDEVSAGRRYLSPPLSLISVMAYAQRTRESAGDPYDALTTREREVLHLSAEGLTSSAIAERLAISARTVETHRANLMRKLALHTRADLVRYAIQKGVLPGAEGGG